MCCLAVTATKSWDGSATFEGVDLLSMAPEARARAGMFLAFQYPVEIPGVSNMEFLKASVDAVQRKHQGLDPELDDAVSFMKLARQKSQSVDLALDAASQARGQRGLFRRREKTQ